MATPPETTFDEVAIHLDGRALRFGYRNGADALVLLLDLAVHAKHDAEGLVVTASYRDLARRFGISKDTIGRRLRLLCQVGAIEALDRPEQVGQFGVRRYRLHPDRVGVQLTLVSALAR